MNQPQKQRRGVAIGLTAVAGLATAALGVVGIAQHGGVSAQQQDVALTAIGDGATELADYNDADFAHAALVTGHVTQNESLFDHAIALQQSIYHWADQNDFADWLFAGDATDASTNLFNGAFTRFSEAILVGQAIQQVQWDHLLGVNQTLGSGGYESAIADSLNDNIAGSGIAPGSALADALDALMESTTQESFSGFHDALVDLQGDLLNTAWLDLLGMFSA